MQRRIRRPALLALAALACPVAAGPLSAQAGPPPAGGGPLARPPIMRLDPALAAKQPPRIVLPGTERLDALTATFKEKFRLTKTALETRRRVTDECLARAYTQQEQQDAGCRPEHSVQTCSEILLCWCRRDASRDHSNRYEELLVADRELKAEIIRLANSVQREPVQLDAHYRCAN